MPKSFFRIGLLIAVGAALALGPIAQAAAAPARIKDIVDVEGIRENQLVGYGLVVGLNGTGDSLNNSPFTKQSLQSMLERLGVNTAGENVRTANVAAVMVTASLPPFATQGQRIDISVASLGNAKSLQGGTLLVTPLLGADGEVFAIAQGPVTINGFSAEGDAASIVSGVPTTGRISSGALVEREIGFELGAQHSLRLALRNPDLTTSRRIAMAINDFIGAATAVPEDPSTVRLTLPVNFNGNIVDLLTDVEQLIIQTDQSAKIVIDENSGIIVMGKDVRVSSVAVAQSNLTVSIAENPTVVQPAPFSQGQTAVQPSTDLSVSQTDTALQVINESVTLQELVDGLNALGISPRDLIAILQAIKATGALQAEIEVL
ncbi:flagellar basal body P-ring protein FlgI [Devosia sp. BK]|uniref:flagellar basal body P-ring protein FlgI n=1 Tax=unclassified Devosia TaxID=196773 RepID=UPI0007127689|nr:MULTISPECIES: flagellar basal body P-ring protein FlgI [unclassified Devosia]KQT44828.1 flagellar biosynthesis protein FlgA [Devosia sp. Leaf420]MDV3250464.1 flagellar basal body P-ring protein FlgI [Devosia sp. BK]